MRISEEKKREKEQRAEKDRIDALEKAREAAANIINNEMCGTVSDKDLLTSLEGGSLDQIFDQQMNDLAENEVTEVDNTSVVETDKSQSTDLSRIFGKGASNLQFDPVRASTTSRDEPKRNASISSEGGLENEEDPSKKIRLDLSPSSREKGNDLPPNVDDSGGSGFSLPDSTPSVSKVNCDPVQNKATEKCITTMTPSDPGFQEKGKESICDTALSLSENTGDNGQTLEVAKHDVSVSSEDRA